MAWMLLRNCLSYYVKILEQHPLLFDLCNVLLILVLASLYTRKIHIRIFLKKGASKINTSKQAVFHSRAPKNTRSGASFFGCL